MKKAKNELMSDVGERFFLKRIKTLVDESLLPFNDDASAVLLPSGEILVVNVDMLVYKTDVLPDMTYEQIGKKAVTMSISDIVAKGAKPYGCLASLGLKPDVRTEDAYKILSGVKEQCSYYGTEFLGGDLNESSDIVLDVASYGVCTRDLLIPRNGARDGDFIFSTGLFGLTYLGYKVLLNGLELSLFLKEETLASVYEPRARIDFLPLFDLFDINACMDSSDGLLITLTDLSRINNLGIEINNVPIHEKIKSYSEENNLNPLELAFKGGEEFELIFAVNPAKSKRLQREAEKLGLKIYHIGEFSEDIKGININDTNFSNFDLPQEGFEHFKKST